MFGRTAQAERTIPIIVEQADRGLRAPADLIDAIFPEDVLSKCRGTPVLGLFPGEGIGHEVLAAAQMVLDAAESTAGRKIHRLAADPLPQVSGPELLEAAELFLQQVFAGGGAVLCGPLGGRCVYDLRRRFGLFCKLAPIHPLPALYDVTRFKPEIVRDMNLVIVRDNAGGVYQGQWTQEPESSQGRVARHCFSYNEVQVRQIADVGVRLARSRTGRMHVVVKDGGVPTISSLWSEVSEQAAAEGGVQCVVVNADFAAYQLIQNPGELSVLLTPNLLGDMLADAAAAFLGSRGMSFSANYSTDGLAVYQTGHGAAKDLAGTNRANPLGQILSLAMLLRESFGMATAAACVENAVDEVLSAGWRTEDIAVPGCRCVGTRQMAELVAQAVRRRSA
jgi:3-isopropylmalate dehydrogenase